MHQLDKIRAWFRSRRVDQQIPGALETRAKIRARHYFVGVPLAMAAAAVLVSLSHGGGTPYHLTGGMGGYTGDLAMVVHFVNRAIGFLLGGGS